MTKAFLKHVMDSKAVSVIFVIPKIGHKEKTILQYHGVTLIL